MDSVTLGNHITAPGAKDFLESIFSTVMLIGMPVIGLVLIYAGFMFITARGNKVQIQTAIRNMTYVVLGTALVLGSYAIGSILYNTIVKGILGWN